MVHQCGKESCPHLPTKQVLFGQHFLYIIQEITLPLFLPFNDLMISCQVKGKLTQQPKKQITELKIASIYCDLLKFDFVGQFFLKIQTLNSNLADIAQNDCSQQQIKLTITRTDYICMHTSSKLFICINTSDVDTSLSLKTKEKLHVKLTIASKHTIFLTFFRANLCKIAAASNEPQNLQYKICVCKNSKL